MERGPSELQYGGSWNSTAPRRPLRHDRREQAKPQNVASGPSFRRRRASALCSALIGMPSRSTRQTLASHVPSVTSGSATAPATPLVRAQLRLAPPQVAAVPASDESEAGQIEALHEELADRSDAERVDPGPALGE